MAALNSCKVPHNRLNMQQRNMTMVEGNPISFRWAIHNPGQGPDGQPCMADVHMCGQLPDYLNTY